MQDRNVSISVTTGTLIKALLIVGAVWLSIQLFDLILVMLTAIVIASGIEPATHALMKRKIPRTLSVIAVYLAFLSALLGTIYILVPVFLVEFTGLIATLPTHLDALARFTGEYTPVLKATGLDPAASVNELLTTLQTTVHGFAGDTFTTIGSVFGGVMSFVLIIVFSFYFSIQERGIENFLRIVAPSEYENYVIGLWKRSQHKIGLWLQGQLLLGILVGLLVYLSLTIIGIPHAFALAVIAALFELIPVFGPILSATPAVLVAITSGGVGLGLLVIAVYVIIQQFENHLIYPLVVTKVVGVPPLLVILALLIGGKLAGFLGILLSAPLAAIVQEVVSDLEARRARIRAAAEGTSQ
jgi:predicted PurR-regulated permease PerM